jgi:hypothetical protein
MLRRGDVQAIWAATASELVGAAISRSRQKTLWQSEPEADEGDVDIEQPAVAAGPPRRRVTIKEAEKVTQRV